MMEYHIYAEISLRGYHAYKNIPLTLGQELLCDIEPQNEHDPFAVMIQTENEDIVGHILLELSEIIHKFPSDGGEAVAEVIGKRYNSGTNMGLEVPLDIKFMGTHIYLKKLRKSLKDILQDANITKIRRCN